MRAPIIPLSVFEVLKVLKLEKPTVVLFTDIATVMSNRKRSTETTGIEFRLAMTLANVPLFIFSYGWAQEWKYYGVYQHDLDLLRTPNPYFQMTLINTF